MPIDRTIQTMNELTETIETKGISNNPSGVSVPINRNELFKLRTTNGLSAPNIAKIMGIGVSTVYKWLDKWEIPNKAALQAYKDTRADQYADAGQRILKTIDQATIKKATLVQRTTAACQLYDKERLENDLSTNNVSVLHASDYDKKQDALDAEYEELTKGG